MRSFSIFLLCCLTQVLAAQTWQWSHQLGGPGSEGAHIIGVDADASVYVYGGYSGPSGLYIGEDTLHGSGSSAFLAKYDADGTLAWVRNCTSSSGVGFNGAVLDTVASRLYLIGGYSNSCTLDTCSLGGWASGGFLSQWNLEGDCLWARNVVVSGPDLANHFCTTGGITIDDQGRVILGGTTTPYGPNYLADRLVPQGTFMAAYTAAGDTLWTRMIAYYQGDLLDFEPVSMRTWNGQLFVDNGIYLNSISDTLVVDTNVFTGIEGGGHALMRIDPSNGSVVL